MPRLSTGVTQNNSSSCARPLPEYRTTVDVCQQTSSCRRGTAHCLLLSATRRSKIFTEYQRKICAEGRESSVEGKGRQLHSGELLHRCAININGLVPTFENAYLLEIDNSVIENTGAVYQSTLYQLVREFVHQRTKGDLQYPAIDVCEIT